MRLQYEVVCLGSVLGLSVRFVAHCWSVVQQYGEVGDGRLVQVS